MNLWHTDKSMARNTFDGKFEEQNIPCDECILSCLLFMGVWIARYPVK